MTWPPQPAGFSGHIQLCTILTSAKESTSSFPGAAAVLVQSVQCFGQNVHLRHNLQLLFSPVGSSLGTQQEGGNLKLLQGQSLKTTGKTKAVTWLQQQNTTWVQRSWLFPFPNPTFRLQIHTPQTHPTTQHLHFFL